MTKPYEKWIVIYDTHIPYFDKKSWRAIEAYMADEVFDGWLHGGDLVDLNELSRWNEDTPRLKTEKTQQTFDKANKFLDIQQKIVRANNKDAKFVLLEGNHEYRVEYYMDRHPELTGLLEVKKNLRLEERGIKWVRSWTKGHIYKKGHAFFTHGLYISKYHAHKMVDTFGTCIFYGHSHDVMEMPKTFAGNDKTLVGKSLGCTCDYKQTYLKGNPTKWQQAITIFNFLPNGFFNEYVIKIFNHKFIAPNGKVYDGNK